MIKYLIRKRLKNHQEGCEIIDSHDIENAKKIIFSVFSRYGDAIISFKLINKFIKQYIDKKYFLVTSNQLYPYAKCLLPDNVSIMSFNKNKNLIKFLKIFLLLKNDKIDLGFNPWSSGESEFFITYAKKFMYFRRFLDSANIPMYYNLFDRVRDYLSLPKEKRIKPAWNFTIHAKRIVISPFSTRVTKSLGNADLAKLIEQVREKFPDADITIASPKQEAKRIRGFQKIFIFRKSKAGSESFLNLLKKTDLVISVDAGPLHLADALGIRTIGLFGPTAPQAILDRTTTISYVQSQVPKMPRYPVRIQTSLLFVVPPAGWTAVVE